MRKQIISLFLFVLLPLAAGAEEAKILSLSGNVEVRQGRDGQWASASENVQIPEGGALRTGAGGMAVLLMPNKTKVWLKENSNIEVEQRQTLVSRLALVFGKVKIRVPHLMRKEKFEVRTPAAVCAVRGTEFTMDTTEDGKMNIQVLFGEVKLKFTVPLEQGKEAMNILQGQTLTSDGKKAVQALSNKMTEWAALSNWNPGITKEESEKGLQQKEADRAEIKEFAKVTNGAEDTVKSFLNVVKESDLEAGRTLNDVHGNLVRVDQRMLRPDPSTIQFFNIVKRPDYANYTYTNGVAAAHGFAYNGGHVTERLDLMQLNVGFNKDLPQRIEEWPGFFNGSDIKPTYMSTIMANKTEVGGLPDIFFIATGAKYDAATDNMENNPLKLLGYSGGNATTDDGIIITGVLKNASGITAAQGLDKISKLEVANTGTLGGLVYTDENFIPTLDGVGAAAGAVVWAQRVSGADTSYSYSSDDANSSQLWNYNADRYRIGGSNQAIGGGILDLWYAMESYVIGNGGNIRATTDFTNSTSDPFTLLKDNAGEVIMALKKYKTGTTGTPYSMIDTADYFTAISNKNIDIVFIPDLMVAAVQRMLPAITKMNDTNKNN
ncbi:MAG: FecR family protein [Elusimicrobiota bacterium]